MFILDPRSGVSIPDPGAQRGAGSRIRIRNTVLSVKFFSILFVESAFVFRIIWDALSKRAEGEEIRIHLT
jgi:hypothetical protein